MPVKHHNSKKENPGLLRRTVHWALKRWAQIGLAGVALAAIGTLLRPQLPSLLNAFLTAPSWLRTVLVVCAVVVVALLIVARIIGYRLLKASQAKRQRQRLERLSHTAFGGAEAGGRKGAAEGIQDAFRVEAEVWLTSVTSLRPNQLKLGDDAAATFPYVREPVEEAFQSVCTRLRGGGEAETLSGEPDASSEARWKRGILVTGEANAGKTRLAFEALRATLPDWDVLQWSAAFTPDLFPSIRRAITGRRIVIWIEDLQEYAPPEGSASALDWHGPATTSRAETLRALVTMVRETAIQEIELATCRQEDAERTRQALGWPFEEYDEVEIPAFPSEPDAPDARHIISLFEAKAAQQQPLHRQSPNPARVHPRDWDGTMGSLVLGLTRKEQQYISLVMSGDPAATILKAMKLLMLAGTVEYTASRVQAVCSEVFQVPTLGQEGSAWYRALGTLIERGFIIRDHRTEALGDGNVGVTSSTAEARSSPHEEVAYTIRKDVYFERVVTDYPNSAIPAQLEFHLRLLRETLAKHRDATALYNLGVRLLERRRLSEALAAYEAALEIAPEDFASWHNYGVTLYLQKSDEKARDAFEHALALRPEDTATVIRLGMVADSLARHLQIQGKGSDAALWRGRAEGYYEKATKMDPQSAVAWINLALFYDRAQEFPRARVAFEKAIELDPGNADWKGWYSSVLLALGSTAEAERMANEARRLRAQEPSHSDAL